MALKEVFARVRVTVELPLNQPWGPDESAANIFQRAKKDALDSLGARLSLGTYRVVGEPVVTMVMADSDATGGGE